MKKVRKMNICFILCFIGILILPLLFVNKTSNKISEEENRYLASFPKIINENTGQLNDNLRSNLELWLNDNIGFRSFFVKLNTLIDFKILKTSPNGRVHIGKDGWYFYTLDNNLEIAKGTYPLSDELLRMIKEEQEFIQKTLADKGIEYILVLTPSKASVYPEKIGGANYLVRETPIDIVANYLKENTTIHVINTKEDLLKYKNEINLYHKTDTHWNEEGAYVAYKSIINKINEIGVIDSSPVTVNKVPSKYKGEFAAMMGDINLLEEEQTTNTEIINPNATRVEKVEFVNGIDVSQGSSHNGNKFFTNPTQEKKALVYGDSFFGSWNMMELLAENFRELNFIWSDQIKNDSVELTKPDIVIFERTERYIYTLANKADTKLAYKPLTSHGAEIIEDTTPTVIKRNKTYDIEITVKNTSTDTWNKNKNVRLCIFQDGQDFGYRVDIPEGIDIKPGEEVTFVLEGFSAPPNESTFLEYQMVEEGIAYFGDKQRVDIVVEN